MSPRGNRVTAALAYRAERVDHWNAVADSFAGAHHLSRAYHARLAEVFRFLVPEGQRVLELGSGTGDLLAALEPTHGVGVDFSPKMMALARERHPHLRFVTADVHDLNLKETFDSVILSDLVNDVWDVQAVLDNVARHCRPDTRVILNTYSRLWQWPLGMARLAHLAKPLLPQNWLTLEDLDNILKLSGFEIIGTRSELLLPLHLPGLTTLANRYLVRLWPWRHGALTNVIVARPAPKPPARAKKPLVSVIVPARNEAGNIQTIVERVPKMGAATELLFVEGGSTDGTWKAIQNVRRRSGGQIRALKQRGKGKADAVRRGFAAAKGDILMVLDADMTVPPEDLVRFYDALQSGKADLANGVRLVYPMEKRAMRLLNLLANKSFSLLFSFLIGQTIKDTLCGTKALTKDRWQRVQASRALWGDFDPFGDFDLIFGAAKNQLRIVDVPVRYGERTYGNTNIRRFEDGWTLVKMAAFAASHLKFV